MSRYTLHSLSLPVSLLLYCIPCTFFREESVGVLIAVSVFSGRADTDESTLLPKTRQTEETETPQTSGFTWGVFVERT